MDNADDKFDRSTRNGLRTAGSHRRKRLGGRRNDLFLHRIDLLSFLVELGIEIRNVGLPGRNICRGVLLGLGRGGMNGMAVFLSEKTPGDRERSDA